MKNYLFKRYESFISITIPKKMTEVDSNINTIAFNLSLLQQVKNSFLIMLFIFSLIWFHEISMEHPILDK